MTEAAPVTTSFEEFRSLVNAARTYLTCRFPFYSYLLHKAVITARTDIPTACVNAKAEIFVNPTFFAEINSPRTRAFVLAHEILHPAFELFIRGRNHHHKLSNYAHDYVINLLLRQESSDWLLKGVLCDDRFLGMSYEQVYFLLKSELPTFKLPSGETVRVFDPSGKFDGKNMPDEGFGKNVDGVVSPASGGADGITDDADFSAGEGDGESGDAEPIDWQKTVARASEAARMQGHLPAHLSRFVGDFLQPVVPWQDKLRLAVTDVLSKTRLDWSYPARRSEAYGCYCPREEYLGFDVSICVDTSGSISADELRRAISEINDIVTMTGGDGRYIVGDAAVHADVALADFHPDLLKGGGGTSFVPHFDHLERYPTKLCIFFTDTFGTFPDRHPDFPVLWAVYQSAVPSAVVPFGEIIPIEL